MRSFLYVTFLAGLAVTSLFSHAMPIPGEKRVVVVTKVVHQTVGVTMQAGAPIQAPKPAPAAQPVVVTVTAQPQPEAQPQPQPQPEAQPEAQPQEEQKSEPQPQAPSVNAANKMWGINYSPYNNDGSCPDAGTVASQLQKISEIAQNIRIFSTDCSQLENSLKAIKENNIPLGVYGGIWISNGEERAQNEIKDFAAAVKQYPGIVKGVSVGNEDMFKGTVSEGHIIDLMEQVRGVIKSEGLGDIEVYTTETDASYSPALADHSDIIQVNVYSIFDGSFGGDIQEAARTAVNRVGGTRSRLNTDKLIRIGESGWSSAGQAPGNVPTSLELEKGFMQHFLCEASRQNLQFFYFEAKNGDWKGNVNELEKNFGVFDSNYNPKFDLGFIGQC